jgi:hypothetical protein
VFLIQSSPSTKDQRDIFEAIDAFSKKKIAINMASLVGETHIYKVHELNNRETSGKV